MIDLHTHSTASDGTLPPEAVAARAAEAGLTAVALTDHDTVAGLPRFLDTATGLGIAAVPGVEISTRRDQAGVHILGLFIDAAHPELAALLGRIHFARRQRNRLILRCLAGLGIELNEDELGAEPGGVACRTHIACRLAERGHADTPQDAFDRYLGRGRPAHVTMDLPPLQEVFRAIHAAGGLAFWAHPAALLGKPLKKARKTCLALRQLGLDGLEAYYSAFDPTHQERLLRLAQEAGLLVTGGSDFHGGTKPDIHLGSGRGQLAVPDSVYERLAAGRGCQR